MLKPEPLTVFFLGAQQATESPDQWNTAATAQSLLRLVAFAMPSLALTMILTGALRGAGDTLWLAAVSAIGAALVLGLGGTLIVRFLPWLGIKGPWIAATLSIITVGLANRWRFKSNRWKKIDLFKRRPVGVPVEIE